MASSQGYFPQRKETVDPSTVGRRLFPQNTLRTCTLGAWEDRTPVSKRYTTTGTEMQSGSQDMQRRPTHPHTFRSVSGGWLPWLQLIRQVRTSSKRSPPREVCFWKKKTLIPDTSSSMSFPHGFLWLCLILKVPMIHVILDGHLQPNVAGIETVSPATCRSSCALVVVPSHHRKDPRGTKRNTSTTGG